MHTTTKRAARGARVIGVVAAATLALSGCSFSFSAGDQAAAASSAVGKQAEAGSIKIQPLFVKGDSGGVGKETITRAPVKDGSFRIDFSEDEVSGLGDSSRAASWNAAIVSTLLTSQPLTGRFGFEIEGKIDGPSAGALKTVALIALANGDKIPKDATMTGTINATGTIGPVGGIPEKIRGASESKIKKVLIPLGQRNTTDSAGNSVDVIREGDKLGVEVVEVGDVYEAYAELTGKKFPAPARDGDPRLDNRSYDKIEAQVKTTYGRYESSVQQFLGLPDLVTSVLIESGVPGQAEDAYNEAQNLQQQGMIAGAYSKAQEAAALMETVYAAGTLVNPLLTEGFDGMPKVFQQATNTQATDSKFMGFLDSLGTAEPKTLSDVEALVNAYAGAFDAYTLLDFANGQLGAIEAGFENGEFGSLEEVFGQLTVALLYQKLAEAQITNTESIYELGRDNGGPAFDEDVDLHQVGDFFRRGAEANYSAFISSGVVKEIADANGLAPDVVVGYVSDYDINVALATHQQQVLPAFEDYIGEDKANSAYAAMGYGLNNYVRNQMLVEKYYNNAVLDENFQVVGLSFESALNNAIDLSRDQLASEITGLRGKKVEPVITVSAYEAAGGASTATPDDKFSLLGQYSGGFVTARLLDYIGGWE